MTASLVLVIAGGALVACGVYLVLERSILRILAGVLLAGNGVNVLFLVASGPSGLAPIIGEPEPEIADPLPQAFVLTAIVISLAASAFLLALSYRSFQLEGHDEVADDVEDALVRRRAIADLPSASFAERSGGSDEAAAGDDTESGGVAEDAGGSDHVVADEAVPGEGNASDGRAATTPSAGPEGLG